MVLLVPLSFGFTYMMIKLAKNAEANAKLQPKKASKGSINITQKWLYVIFVMLLAFQVYLNISAYYAVLQGMNNWSLFIIGIIMLVFASNVSCLQVRENACKGATTKACLANSL